MNQRTSPNSSSRKTTPSSGVRRTLAVDINGDGKRVNVDLSSISKADFTAYHGQTVAGNTVNSLHAKRIGKSTILRTGEKGPAIAATDDEIEVFATKWLGDKGFQIQPPQMGSGQGNFGN